MAGPSKVYPTDSPQGLVWNESLGDWACPTDVCGALCCRQDPWKGREHQPCQFLSEDKLCELHHSINGHSYKPQWCSVWPRSQQDVDSFNKAALKEYGPGHPMHMKQCQLKFLKKIIDLRPTADIQRITILPWPTRSKL